MIGSSTILHFERTLLHAFSRLAGQRIEKLRIPGCTSCVSNPDLSSRRPRRIVDTGLSGADVGTHLQSASLSVCSSSSTAAIDVAAPGPAALCAELIPQFSLEKIS
jgi:hypothetical protein